MIVISLHFYFANNCKATKSTAYQFLNYPSFLNCEGYNCQKFTMFQNTNSACILVSGWLLPLLCFFTWVMVWYVLKVISAATWSYDWQISVSEKCIRKDMPILLRTFLDVHWTFIMLLFFSPSQTLGWHCINNIQMFCAYWVFLW